MKERNRHWQLKIGAGHKISMRLTSLKIAETITLKHKNFDQFT